jgi:hypothetical protein
MSAARDLTVDAERAALLATPISVIGLALVWAPHYLAWGENALRSLFRATGGWAFGPAILGGIVLHEALHAAVWALGGRLRPGEIRFGFQWRVLMPYAHPRRPIPARAYAIGAAAPGIVLGLLPGALGVATGHGALAGWGAIFTAAAAGDALVLWTLRDVPATARVRDHPTRVGCEVVGDPDAAG